MALKQYEKKDISKSPKTKAAPKKGEIYKEGDLWKFIWINNKVRSYETKKDAEISLEKLSGQAKSTS